MATQTTTLPVHAAPLTGVSLPAFTLWWREVVRFYRQRTRVVGVIASPVVFWLVIGSGFGSSFRSGGSAGQQHYLDYFSPGALFPLAGASGWIRLLMRINPPSYGVEALRSLLYPASSDAFPLASSLATLILFAGAMFGLSFLMVNRRTTTPAA